VSYSEAGLSIITLQRANLTIIFLGYENIMRSSEEVFVTAANGERTAVKE
jgi:hypothetical protein